MHFKCWDLLRKKYFQKLFHLIDRFWEVINDLSVDIDCLVKNKNPMDKIQWKKFKAKGKMVVAFLEIVTLRK